MALLAPTADLALRLLEESLEVHKPDDEVQHTPSSPSVDFYIERECARRCFWLIQVMGWINGIYTYRPMRPRSVQLMESIRLPVDETTFELAAHWSSASELRCNRYRAGADRNAVNFCFLLDRTQRRSFCMCLHRERGMRHSSGTCAGYCPSMRTCKRS